MIEENNISPIRSDFEQIKKQNESGSEYWTSRDLCVALGYSTYQKFTRTINKAKKRCVISRFGSNRLLAEQNQSDEKLWN